MTTLKLTWRGITSNLGRLSLTLFVVFLGVSFVSGSFVLADSLRSVFNQISEDAFAGVDAQVRAVEPEIQSSEFTLPRFDDSLVAEINKLDEVEFAEGGLFSPEQTYSLDTEGELNRPQGPPVFTVSWGGESPVSSFTISEGKAPTGQQVALDQTQVTAGGFALGDQVEMSLPTGEPEQFELSAIIDFGEGGTGGAYFNLFDLPTTQRILQISGEVDSIVVNGQDSVSEDKLLASIAAVLPADIEVVSGDTVIGEQQEDFGSFINVFGNILLGFAVVILFVATFIIYNTFAILVGQRTRQIGLLRSIGASANQIRLMVLVESFIIGLLASVAGLVAGLGVAWLLKRLLENVAGSFPDGPLELQPRTIWVVMLVGLLVTTLSALVPALRAAKVSPLDAVRDEAKKERSMRYRLIAAAVVLVPAVAALAFGMFGSIDGTTPRLALIGFGSAFAFIGVSMASALFASQASRLIGRPLFVAVMSLISGVILFAFGLVMIAASGFLLLTAFTRDSFLPEGILILVPAILSLPIAYVGIRTSIPTVIDGARMVIAVFTGGPVKTLLTLSKENAARNPQRTAATATALMIGLALISGVTVLTSSLLATVDDLLQDSITADFFVYEAAQQLPFSAVLVDQLQENNPQAQVAGFSDIKAKLDGDVVDITGFDTETGTNVVNPKITEGTAELTTSGIAVFVDTATEKGLSLGDSVEIEFEDGFLTDLKVEAIYEDDSALESTWFLNRDLTSQHAELDEVGFVGVTFPEGTAPEANRASIETVADNFQQLTVQDNTEFQSTITGQISGLRNLLTGLLAMCLVMAFFGIINTMALSVLERTREIGLLRAVGMTQQQLKSTIRSEAVIVSVFGALVGVLMGLLLGWAAVVAIPDSFISKVSLPPGQLFLLFMFAIVGSAIGLVAAYFPAQRASKLNVLDAVSHE